MGLWVYVPSPLGIWIVNTRWGVWNLLPGKVQRQKSWQVTAGTLLSRWKDPEHLSFSKNSSTIGAHLVRAHIFGEDNICRPKRRMDSCGYQLMSLSTVELLIVFKVKPLSCRLKPLHCMPDPVQEWKVNNLANNPLEPACDRETVTRICPGFQLLDSW